MAATRTSRSEDEVGRGWRAAVVLLALPEDDGGQGRTTDEIRASYDEGVRVRTERSAAPDATTSAPLRVDEVLDDLRGHPELIRIRSQPLPLARQSGGSDTRLQYTRQLETLQLDMRYRVDEVRLVDALCWLIRSLHHDTTDGQRAKLQLPATVTSLSRVLAAVLRATPSRTVERQALRWLAPELLDTARDPVAPELGEPTGPDSWPPTRLQPLAYDRLGAGNPGRRRLQISRMAQLRGLILACRKDRCRLTYASPSRGELLEFEVRPWCLALRGGVWYLVADHGGEPRTYRLERIVAVEADEQPDRTDVDLDVDAVHRALRFDPPHPDTARLRWHRQDIRPPRGSRRPTDATTDGEADVDVGRFVLRSWTLANAPDAEVVRPRELRDGIETACRLIEQRHDAGPTLVSDEHDATFASAEGVAYERQLATMMSLTAWGFAPAIDDDDRTSERVTALVARSLSFAGEDAELLRIREGLLHAADTAHKHQLSMPVVALTYEERVMLHAVLAQAARIPLPPYAREALDELSFALQPALSDPWLVTVVERDRRDRGARRDLLAARIIGQEPLRVSYHGRGRSQETFIFQPWSFAATPRHEYVRGAALGEDGGPTPRWLRLDRIATIQPADVATTRTDGLGRPPSEPHQGPSGVTGADHPYRLLLDPPAWWLLDELSPDCWPEDTSGGPVVVNTVTDEPSFVHQLVLRGAGHAELLDPSDERSQVADLARRCAARHQPLDASDDGG